MCSFGALRRLFVRERDVPYVGYRLTVVDGSMLRAEDSASGTALGEDFEADEV